ncbi:MAG: putative 2OG-Fe(II) oxygenase [Flavobacteriales bacterium]|nr:putative 2OG-Fe(II) oxygenase [Flavobacteriales bacterium]
MSQSDILPGINDLPNIGVHIEKLNPFVFASLKKDCLEGISNVDKSIGNRTGDILQMFHQDIPKEFFFQEPTTSKENLTNEVIKICDNFKKTFPEVIDKLNTGTNKEQDDYTFYVERFWINYQRPGEFIPLHRHSGIFSFVVWVSLPIAQQEFENQPVERFNLSKGCQGQFEFVYTDMLGQIKQLRLAHDKSWEGSICVFPAELNHQVYPHYQDEYRITVSGNIRAKV